MGVLTGNLLYQFYQEAKESGCTVPSIKCWSSFTCWKAIEFAAKYNSPLCITIIPPKKLGSSSTTCQADLVSHATSLAWQVRQWALEYNVPVILHSQHCLKLLPWLEGLLEADQTYYREYGEPLFSSHGIDLRHDPHGDENLAIGVKYFVDRFVKIDLWLEMTIVAPSWQEISHAQASFVRFGQYFSICVTHKSNDTKLDDDNLPRLDTMEKVHHNDKAMIVVSRSTNAVNVLQCGGITNKNLISNGR